MSDEIKTPDSTAAPANAADYPLPPATFDFLVMRLVTEAQMFLGLLHFGEKDEETKPNFKAAQHAIDMLGTLQEKTKGNLSMEEVRLLENSLTELRFRYVQVTESGKANG